MFTLDNLNSNQREAVETLDKPLLILAGAGSGKTRTIISRIINILDQSRAWPGQILAITFTNKAANEMKERVASYGIPETDRMWVSTIHAACTRILRADADRLGYSKQFKILDSYDQQIVVKQILKRLNLDPKKYKPGDYLRVISNLKNQGKTFEDYNENEPDFDYTTHKVFHEYTRRLRQMDAMDFDDSATRFQVKSLDM